MTTDKRDELKDYRPPIRYKDRPKRITAEEEYPDSRRRHESINKPAGGK